MMILVDTSVWSLSLRRRTSDLSHQDRTIAQSLEELVKEGRAQLLGVVRQEVLSGIRDETQFRRISEDLRGFADVPLMIEHFEQAAAISNKCRRSGIASSNVDMLICSVSLDLRWPIFTTDRDFFQYARVLPIRLFSPSPGS